MFPNPYKTLSSLRAVVQGAYVAFFLLAGYEFHLFYTRIVAGAAVTGRRPPSVEAFPVSYTHLTLPTIYSV